jgi:hypothetical protein
MSSVRVDIQPSIKSHLDVAQKKRLADFADQLISGGAGLPSASAADVQGAWMDRTLAARPDLAEVIIEVIKGENDPTIELERLRREDSGMFSRFAFAVSGAYLMNPRVRDLLGLPGNAPKPNPAFPDEADHYLANGILNPVIERGPIYRPTPPATT